MRDCALSPWSFRSPESTLSGVTVQLAQTAIYLNKADIDLEMRWETIEKETPPRGKRSPPVKKVTRSVTSSKVNRKKNVSNSMVRHQTVTDRASSLLICHYIRVCSRRVQHVCMYALVADTAG